MQIKDNHDDATFQAIIRFNILNLLADVLDSALRDARNYFKANGQDLCFEAKRDYNACITNLAKFIGNRQIERQEGVAMVKDKCEEANQIYQLILTLVDRAGESDDQLFRFYEYIKSFPSKVGIAGMKESEDKAFENMYSKKNKRWLGFHSTK